MLAIAENSNEFVEDMKESKKTLATIYRGARPTLHITYIKVKKKNYISYMALNIKGTKP